jgi:hypothetical protein
LTYRRKKLGTYIAVLVAGLILGGLLGELIAVLPIPEGVVKDFFTATVNPSVGAVGGPGDPGTLDLIVLRLSAGMAVRLNVMSLVGLLIAAYLFREFL